MNTIELVEAIERLRAAGWTVEPPAKSRANTGPKPKKRVGRPAKNGRRKRSRPRKGTT